MTLATAFVSIRPDTTGFGARLSKSVDTSAGKAGKDASSKFSSGFKSALKIGGALTAAFAVTKGVSFFKDAIAEATEARKVGAQTAAVLKSTGGAAGITAKQIGDLSNALSTKAGIDDEVIQSGANVLLTFRNIRNEAGKGNDIFNQTTAAALDMSAALGKDLRSSSIMVGKALNDPIKGMTALGRAGVQFTGQQEAMVKALVKGGDANAAVAMGIISDTKEYSDILKQHKGDGVAAYKEITASMTVAQKKQFDYLSEGGHQMQAQKQILRELNKEFKGSAEAQATPAEKAAVAWGNFKEMIGTAVLPIVDKLANVITNNVLPAMTTFVKGVQNGTGAGGRFRDVVTTLGNAIGTAAGFIKDNQTVVKTFVGILGGFLIINKIVKAVAAFNLVLAANPIGLVVVAVAALAAGLVYAYKHSETFRKIVDGAFNAVKAAASAVVGWFRNKFVPFFTETIPGAFRATVGWVKRNWPVILAIITGPIGLATLFISRHWDQITGAFKAARNWATGAFKRSWSAVKDVLTAPITFARDTIRNIFGAGGPVRTAFSNAVAGIRRIWGNLRDAVRQPIGFIVNTVFNKGIVPFVNRIPFIPGELKTISGFASGGWTGPGEKYRPAGVVHADEHVWTKEESNRFPGGHAGLERLRAEVRAGRVKEGQGWGGYATGGRVKMDGNWVSTIAARQIRLMEQMSKVNFRVMQGGYGGNGVAASGTSHNYPGVVDMSPATIQFERLARRVGFAAWARNIPGRSSVGSGAHIHAVSLLDPGDRNAPQVYGSWRNHGNGLSGANNDPAPHVPWLPGLSKLLGGIPLTNLGGGPGGSGYAGPSAGEARSSLNPAKWLGALNRMGPWGRALGGTVSGVVGGLRDAVVGKIQAAMRVAGRVATGGAGPTSGPVSQTIRRAANTYGWGQGDQWNALANIISHESSWNPNAQSKSSSAYGLFQLTRANWPGGRKPTSIEAQAAAGLGYIQKRYSDPIGAWDFWQRHGVYDQGGIATGRGYMMKNTLRPERVLSSRQTELHDRQTVALERLAASNNSGLGPGPIRIVLDVGGGVTFTGHIDDRIRGHQSQSATIGRQRIR